MVLNDWQRGRIPFFVKPPGAEGTAEVRNYGMFSCTAHATPDRIFECTTISALVKVKLRECFCFSGYCKSLTQAFKVLFKGGGV